MLCYHSGRIVATIYCQGGVSTPSNPQLGEEVLCNVLCNHDELYNSEGDILSPCLKVVPPLFCFDTKAELWEDIIKLDPYSSGKLAFSSFSLF